MTSTLSAAATFFGVDQQLFPLPDEFSFDPKEWLIWKIRFQRYHTLANLGKFSPEVQISFLIFTMGEKAEEIMSSFSLSEEDKKDYSKVMEAFDNHFVVERNVVLERALFGMRNQEEGESVVSFVTALHKLAEHCDYGTSKEDLIRDRIVLGVRDKELSEELMLMNRLTLAEAFEFAKQWEELTQLRENLNSEGKPRSVVGNGKPTATPRLPDPPASPLTFQEPAPTRVNKSLVSDRKPYQCSRCGKRYYTEGPALLHQNTCQGKK